MAYRRSRGHPEYGDRHAWARIAAAVASGKARIAAAVASGKARIAAAVAERNPSTTCHACRPWPSNHARRVQLAHRLGVRRA